MNLKGDLIYLRALEPSDLDFFFQIENDSDYWHLSNTVTPYSNYALKSYIKRSLSEDIYSLKELRLVICNKENHQKIGLIDLFDFDPFHKRAGIGIILNKEDNRGKGLATDSLKTLLKYSFNVLKLNQVYCNILSDNQKSINLFLNQNFNQIGVKKQWHFDGEKYNDELLFQLLKQNAVL